MKGIQITEELSNNFGEFNSRVIKMRCLKAEMDFVIKKHKHCSVSLCRGSMKGIKELTLLFVDTYQPFTLINQVDDTRELKAMYSLGFRALSENNKHLNQQQTLDLLNSRSSILMAWKGFTPW